MEKRRYFRIDDQLELQCERLTDDQMLESDEGIQASDVQWMLASYDRQIQTIIESARIQAPAVANLAEMLNRKMNFIISALSIGSELLETVAFSTQQVNLSACGIAFYTDLRYDKRERVRLEMRLQPSNVQLVLLARVISCEPVTDRSPEQQFHLRLNFEGMSRGDEELMIQYIVRRQSQLLQEERKAREFKTLGE